MARTRLLHPDFFKHEGLAELPREARLLYMGLWTLADREGRLEDRPIRIHAELFPYEEGLRIGDLLEQLHEAGFITRYEHTRKRYIAIPSFLRWQKPHKNEKPSEIPTVESARDITRVTPEITRATRAVSVSVSVSNSVSDSVSVSGSVGGLCSELASPPAEPAVPPGEAEAGAEREALESHLPGSPAPSTPLAEYVGATWPKKIPDIAKVEPAWREAYPAVELLAEAKRARAWELANPRNQKSDIRRFLGSWFGRTQDRASRNGTDPPVRRVTEAPSPASAFGAGGEVKL